LQLGPSSDIKTLCASPLSSFISFTNKCLRLNWFNGSRRSASHAAEGKRRRRGGEKKETRNPNRKRHRNEFSCLSRNFRTQLHNSIARAHTHAPPRTWKVHKRVPGDCRLEKQNRTQKTFFIVIIIIAIGLRCLLLFALSPLNLHSVKSFISNGA
jgi:hypothetical protein